MTINKLLGQNNHGEPTNNNLTGVQPQQQQHRLLANNVLSPAPAGPTEAAGRERQGSWTRRRSTWEWPCCEALLVTGRLAHGVCLIVCGLVVFVWFVFVFLCSPFCGYSCYWWFVMFVLFVWLLLLGLDVIVCWLLLLSLSLVCHCCLWHWSWTRPVCPCGCVIVTLLLFSALCACVCVRVCFVELLFVICCLLGMLWDRSVGCCMFVVVAVILATVLYYYFCCLPDKWEWFLLMCLLVRFRGAAATRVSRTATSLQCGGTIVTTI